MDVSHLLDELNEAQRQAVTAPIGHLLVLAGAGSGKTKVLVHRIAWLLLIEKLSPFNILAVTFTNKAAQEMRGRFEKLIASSVSGMWIGTFHGIANRLLRKHWQEANLSENFQILDSDDQLRILRRLIKSLDLDESKWPAKQAQWFINAQKDAGLRAKDIPANDYFTNMMQRIYQLYEEACERTNSVDFAELLLRTHELWLQHPSILQHYQQRFQHVLVDEFQDTNTVQYAWLKMLVGNTSYLTIVGDDDQSIYGWRGAKIENIHSFSNDLNNVQTIRLEQNYRSTGNILAAANALIHHNDTRLGKNLWTAEEQGELIAVYAGFNEIDEARFVVERIVHWANEMGDYRDVAVLYRSNAQSRVLEEALLQRGIAYRVYGGLRFFERAEIKDVLAYLRLMVNHNDDAAFERVVNLPVRGIGERTMQVLRQYAKDSQQSLWQSTLAMLTSDQLIARGQGALKQFLEIILNLQESCNALPLDEQLECIIQQCQLVAHYSKEKGERGQARIENLNELINAAKEFIADDQSEYATAVQFLAHATLEAGEMQGQASDNCVQLMTLHSAKGLEFPLVFICGIEEGLFPHQMSLEEPGRLEEERRLCYVGITRAMKKLYLTYAETRRFHGTENYNAPSRFLREIPTQLLEEIRIKTKVSQPVSFSNKQALINSTIPHDSGFRVGQTVSHNKFGQGVILNHEGHGIYARVQVKFHNGESKWLVVSYANLQAI